MLQFALVSLIPGLLRNLEDCADPDLDLYEKCLVMPTSLRTSDRKSCRVENSTAMLVANNGQYLHIWDYRCNSLVKGRSSALIPRCSS